MEKLTPQEEDAMQAIWKSGGGSVKDILDRLADPSLPYTSLAYTIKNLENKGFLSREKVSNWYRYFPAIEEEVYKKRFMKGFVADYFQSSFKDLVLFFANDEAITAEELEEVLRLIPKKNIK